MTILGDPTILNVYGVTVPVYVNVQDYSFMAMGRNGDIYIYEEKPYIYEEKPYTDGGEEHWESRGKLHFVLSTNGKYTSDWRYSLVHGLLTTRGLKMSRTIRREPRSGMWLRRFKHVSFRKSEEASIDRLREQILVPSNRHSSFSSRIRNPWDDIIVSYYRGQKWSRKYL